MPSNPGLTNANIVGDDGGTKVTVKDLANSNPMAVQVVDSNGDAITAFGGSGGTASNFGAAFPSQGTAVGFEDASGDMAPVVLEADGSVPVTIIGGSSAGTEYTEGDTDASFSGGIALAEGPSDTATPLQVDASKHLQVDIAADSAGLATAANQATIIGHVDGTEGLLATIDADTGAIVTATEAIQTAVEGTLAVAGTVTANAGTDLNTSALALESGGNLAGAATSLEVIDDWDESDRAKVNPIAGQAGVQGGSGTVTALTQRVVLATDVALPAGTNAIGKLAANSGVDIGDVDVTSISAGTNAIGNVGLIGRTSGGLAIFRSLDIDETEEDVKTSAGQLFVICAFNRTAAPLYLKFYNATAANVTVGSTTPVMTFVVPGNADSDGAGFVLCNPLGWEFSTAISVACTTGVADADTGAPGANDCVINLGYM